MSDDDRGMIDESAKDQLKSFARSLESPRLIKIVVGQDTGSDVGSRVFWVQETVLNHASEYFKNAIKHAGRMGDGNDTEVLRYETDDVEVWELLLFWMFNKRLPTEEEDMMESLFCENDLPLLFRTWITADRYLMQGLQDNVMIELVFAFHVCKWDAAIDMVAEVFKNTIPESPLRALFAEVLARAIRDGKTGFEGDQLTALDGTIGLAQTLTRAQLGTENDLCWALSFHALDRESFMVGEGPRTHWIYAKYPGDSLDTILG